jgi:hypothetical protein
LVGRGVVVVDFFAFADEAGLGLPISARIKMVNCRAKGSVVAYGLVHRLEPLADPMLLRLVLAVVVRILLAAGDLVKAAFCDVLEPFCHACATASLLGERGEYKVRTRMKIENRSHRERNLGSC